MFSNPTDLGQQTLESRMSGQQAAYDPGYTLPNVFSTPSTQSAQASSAPWSSQQLQQMNNPFGGLGQAIQAQGVPQVNSALAAINQYANNSAATALQQQSQFLAAQAGNQMNSAMSQPLPSQRWNQQYDGQIQAAARVNQPLAGNITQQGGPGLPMPSATPTNQMNIAPNGKVMSQGAIPRASGPPSQQSTQAPQGQGGPNQSQFQISPDALQHMGNTYDKIQQPSTKQAYASEAYNAFNLMYNHGVGAGVIPQPYAAPAGDTKPQVPAAMAVMNYTQNPAVSSQQQKTQSMVNQYSANPSKQIADQMTAAGGMDPSHSIPQQQADALMGKSYSLKQYGSDVTNAQNAMADQSGGMSQGDQSMLAAAGGFGMSQ